MHFFLMLGFFWAIRKMTNIKKIIMTKVQIHNKKKFKLRCYY